MNFIVRVMSIAEIALHYIPLFQLWFSNHMTVASLAVIWFWDPAERGLLCDITPYILIDFIKLSALIYYTCYYMITGLRKYLGSAPHFYV